MKLQKYTCRCISKMSPSATLDLLFPHFGPPTTSPWWAVSSLSVVSWSGPIWPRCSNSTTLLLWLEYSCLHLFWAVFWGIIVWWSNVDPNQIVSFLGFFYLCATLCENWSGNETVGLQTDRQMHTAVQKRLYIWSMLWYNLEMCKLGRVELVQNSGKLCTALSRRGLCVQFLRIMHKFCMPFSRLAYLLCKQ